MVQTEIDWSRPGKIARDRGIKRALDHAEQEEPGWSDQAYTLFIQWIKSHGSGFKFMCEDARLSLSFQLTLPPTSRVWGSIVLKAARMGLIFRRGYKSVSNAKAHGTPASVWEVV